MESKKAKILVFIIPSIVSLVAVIFVIGKSGFIRFSSEPGNSGEMTQKREGMTF